MNLGLFFSLLLVLISLCSECFCCDRCVHTSLAAQYSSPSAKINGGSCGYGSLAVSFNGGFVGAVSSDLYRNGIGCGACFEIRCKNVTVCSRKGVKVVVTDYNADNSSSVWMLGEKAFMGLSKPKMGWLLKKQGPLEVEYKRIPCDYGIKNLSLRVEEGSRNPNYLVVKVVFQGGQTDIVAIDVAEVGSSNWMYLTRMRGMIWTTDRLPSGPLQFRFVVTSGFDGKWIWAKQVVLPYNWKPGLIYDTGVQINDIAQEGCTVCDPTIWS